MKRIGITLFVMFLVTLTWTILLLPVGADNQPGTDRHSPMGTSSSRQVVAGSPALPGDSPQTTAQSAASDRAFSVEKIVIASGLFLVIILAVFKWGASSRPKKQEQEK